MNNLFFDKVTGDPMNRVDGKLKVTGEARYSAEYVLPDMVHGVIIPSAITKGYISNIDSKAAERAPGVLAVISHINSIKVPGHAGNSAEPAPGGQPLRVFYDNRIYSNGQPVVIVVADTLERARYAASLVKLQYNKEIHKTDFDENRALAKLPASAKKNPKSPLADYNRGIPDGYKTAPVIIEAEYVHPSEFHNPMELQSVIAHWEAEDKLLVYDKVQGTQPTQRAFAKEWNLPVENVKVVATFVGGAFGNGLHNWPHETAAIIAAKMVKRPVKLMLSREQMFYMVGYRPHTWQKINMGADRNGRIVGISHESVGQTSSYEEFTESTLQQTRMMYSSPNVSTRYRILPLDVSTPVWMRGPGEATGAFALESMMDEMAFALQIDPVKFRLLNYTERDPERNLPWSTKYLRECIENGAEKIGWKKRQMQPASLRQGEWYVGYGMGVGTFGAHRGPAAVRAKLQADGRLLIQSAVTDIGPGTATAMVQIASDAIGMDPGKITFQLGNSEFPMAPNQGGSAVVASVGSAVVAACTALKTKLLNLAGAADAAFSGSDQNEVIFEKGALSVKGQPGKKLTFSAILQQQNLKDLTVTEEAKPGNERNNYSMYSFSVHFAEVHVHAVTGQVKVNKVVTCADAGTIVNKKTAGNQMIGGVTGGIGMALQEKAIIDHRFGRYVTKDFADYHIPVHADVPEIEVYFVNKPDLVVNPMGTKGLGEIATIGVAPAIANAVFNATGKRIRNLPVTADMLI